MGVCCTAEEKDKVKHLKNLKNQEFINELEQVSDDSDSEKPFDQKMSTNHVDSGIDSYKVPQYQTQNCCPGYFEFGKICNREILIIAVAQTR